MLNIQTHVNRFRIKSPPNRTARNDQDNDNQLLPNFRRNQSSYSRYFRCFPVDSPYTTRNIQEVGFPQNITLTDSTVGTAKVAPASTRVQEL